MNRRLKRTLMTTLPGLGLLMVFQNCAENADLPIYKTSSSVNGAQPAAAGQGNTKTCTFFLDSGNIWTVPSDFNSANNTIEAIGNGSDAGGNVRAGGGGGAYSKSVNVTLPPGQPVAYSVAHVNEIFSTSGHTASVGSGDSYLCNSTANCASMAGGSVVVGAAGGSSSTNGAVMMGRGSSPIDAIGGLGGQASVGVATGPGAVKYSGGNGGNCTNSDCGFVSQAGSGGGAAGPHGNGGQGGAGPGVGGAADAGVGTQFDATHAIGAGGGGGASGGAGGNGGRYGGGAGGGGLNASSTAIGGGGLIVIKYLGRTCM